MGTERPRRVTVHGDREVVVEFDPDLTFECVDGCTWCCHRGVVLSGRDLQRLLDRSGTAPAHTEAAGRDIVGRETKNRERHVDIDGAACYFLDDDGLCALEREHDWKPMRCSLFPLEVQLVGGDIHVSVRADAQRNCEGLDVSERRVIDNLGAFLPAALWELPEKQLRSGV